MSEPLESHTFNRFIVLLQNSYSESESLSVCTWPSEYKTCSNELFENCHLFLAQKKRHQALLPKCIPWLVFFVFAVFGSHDIVFIQLWYSRDGWWWCWCVQTTSIRNSRNSKWWRYSFGCFFPFFHSFLLHLYFRCVMFSFGAFANNIRSGDFHFQFTFIQPDWWRIGAKEKKNETNWSMADSKQQKHKYIFDFIEWIRCNFSCDPFDRHFFYVWFNCPGSCVPNCAKRQNEEIIFVPSISFVGCACYFDNGNLPTHHQSHWIHHHHSNGLYKCHKRCSQTHRPDKRI